MESSEKADPFTKGTKRTPINNQRTVRTISCPLFFLKYLLFLSVSNPDAVVQNGKKIPSGLLIFVRRKDEMDCSYS